MSTICDILHQGFPDRVVRGGNTLDSVYWFDLLTEAKTPVTGLELENAKKTKNLNDIREIRDGKLNELDIVLRNLYLNNNLPIPQNYLDYKQALKDLPQDIAAGTIPAPTLDANGQLIFNDWPVLVP